MNSIPQSSGIYQILCTSTNKVYIGSAINLQRRYKEHWKQLKGNRHTNNYLQNAWNKYGETAFQFDVIELVLFSFLLEREQYWIDRTKSSDPQFGFNICPTAGSNLGRTFPDSMRKALSDAHSTEWHGFVTPDGKLTTIRNLWGFCRENGLSFGAMWNLATGNGRIKSYKGWSHRDNQPKGRFVKTYEGFVDPEGNEVPPITNMSAFCRERGLNASHMRELHSGTGRSRHHRGWTCKK